MTKYNVHLHPIVCVTVHAIEAKTQVEAIEQAEALVDLGKLFAGLTGPHWDINVAAIRYAEGMDGFLVDEVGDTRHERSRCYDNDYQPI